MVLVVMGEDVPDYGWLENDRGQIVARYDSSRSLHAGGRLDNRVQMSLTTLDAGRYRIRYRSDDIHSYGRWSGAAPTHPEFWGIRVFDITSGEVENARQTLDSLQPVNLPTRVTAVAEGEGNGHLFVGINRPGLWMFDTSRKVFSRHDLPLDDHVLSAGYIRIFHRARDGTLWIGSTFGLSHYDVIFDLVGVLSENLRHDSFTKLVEILSHFQNSQEVWEIDETVRREIFVDNDELSAYTLKTYAGLIVYMENATDAYELLKETMNSTVGSSSEPLQ